MKRPKFPHLRTFCIFAYIVSMSFLVGLFLLPKMIYLWIAFGLFSCLMLYPFFIGIKQKCYLYSVLIMLAIFIVGIGFYILQNLYLPG